MINILLRNIIFFPVLIPLIIAICGFCFSWRFNLLRWASFLNFALTLVLFKICYPDDEFYYVFGGWQRAYGIEFQLTLLRVIFLSLVSLIGFVASFFIEEKQSNSANFQTLFCLNFAAACGLILSADLFNIYVFMELFAISAYCLVVLAGDRAAIKAAFNYLVIGTIGSVFYLYGIGLIYANFGSLNFKIIAKQLPLHSDLKTLNVSMIFITACFIMKFGLVPFHKWLIDLYRAAPSSVVIFFSGATSKVFIFLAIQFLFFFYQGLPSNTNELQLILLYLGLLAAFYGNFLAIFEKNFRHIFALSSISNIGYIVCLLSLNTDSSIIAAVIVMFSHSLAKAGLFAWEAHNKAPWDVTHSPTLLFILLATLTGLPFTFGFVGKWFMLNQFALTSKYLPMGLLIAASALGLIVAYRIFEHYLRGSEAAPRKYNAATLALTALVGLNIYLGFYTQDFVEVVRLITQSTNAN